MARGGGSRLMSRFHLSQTVPWRGLRCLSPGLRGHCTEMSSKSGAGHKLSDPLP